MNFFQKKIFLSILSIILLQISIPKVVANEEELNVSKVYTKFPFFPYDSCLLLHFNRVVHKKTEHVVSAEAQILKVFSGKFQKGKNVNIIFNSPIQLLFNVEDVHDLMGKKRVIAFNILKENRITNTISVNHECVLSNYFPNSISNPKSFEKQIPKACFPFTSCIIGVVKSIKSEQDDTKISLRVMKSFATNFILPTKRLNGILNGVSKNNFPPFYTFKMGEKITLQIDTNQNNLNEKSIGKEYLICCNPKQYSSLNNLREFTTIGSFRIRRLAELDKNKLLELTSSARARNIELGELRANLENYVRQRWTFERIKEFLDHPELRDIAPFHGVELSEEILLGGQLYQYELGVQNDLVWYSSLKNGLPTDKYLVVLVDSKGHRWVFESRYFDLNNSYDNYYEDLLYLSLLRSFQAYLQVRWDKPHQRIDISCPKNLIEVKKNDKNQVVNLICELEDGSKLSADVNSKCGLSNILVDGKNDKNWNEAYEKRVENMDSLWKKWANEGKRQL